VSEAPISSIQPRDRLGFTLFLAASLHVAIILGIGFSSDLNLDRTPSIEVTLALYNDEKAPENADYIAATNQAGSGDAGEKSEPTTRERTPFHDEKISPIAQLPEPAPSATQARQIDAVATTGNSDFEVAKEVELRDKAEQPFLEEQNYETLLHEIASLEARISEEEDASANAPRIRRLTSVSAKSMAEAAYLNTWREKVERIGNANFPDAGLFGDLRLLVVLREDGTLADIRVITSSGYPPLDAAAERIVRLAAPFQPFPVEMRKKYDRLEIIRTWKFSRYGTALSQ
jgi:periplasmic protein TonB